LQGGTLKVCLAINSSPWSAFKGGGQLAVHHLACALFDKGHKVHVLYSKKPNEHFDVEVPYKVHWAHHYDFATVNLNILSFSKVLGPLAEKERFDVIHGNAEESYLIGKIAKKYKSAYFFTSHVPSVPTTGMIKGMVRPIRFLKTLNTYFLRQAIVEADQIITFSQFSRDLIIKGIGDTFIKKINVIAPGVESSWFEVERKPSSSPTLLFWGRIEEEKGLPELLHALKTVAEIIKDIKLTMVGEGSRLEDYKSLATELSLTDRVEFTGWLSSSQIQNRIPKSSLGVFPSRIESFGLSVIESMAAGLPVIASTGGAVPENIEESMTGTLVPVNDVQALAREIISLLRDPKHAESMAKSAKKRVQEKFNWDKAANKTVDLYNLFAGT